MAQTVSDSEVRAFWDSLLTSDRMSALREALQGGDAGPFAADVARSATALAGLAAVLSAGSPGVAGLSGAALVAAVVAGVRGQAGRQTMPVAEQEVWESVGARFEPQEVVGEGIGRRAVAYAELVGRSVQGDGAMAAALGVDRSRISQRVNKRTLYSFPSPADESRCFPRWQIGPKGTVRGLTKVLPALDPGLHPLTVDAWMTTPAVDLVVGEDAISPIEWLRTGGAIDPVVDLAIDL